MRLATKGPMRNYMRNALRGLGDCLGICHKGNGKLDNWNLGDEENIGQFKVWSGIE